MPVAIVLNEAMAIRTLKWMMGMMMERRPQSIGMSAVSDQDGRKKCR